MFFETCACERVEWDSGGIEVLMLTCRRCKSCRMAVVFLECTAASAMCAALHFLKICGDFFSLLAPPRAEIPEQLSLFLPAARRFILSSSPVRFHLLLERETMFQLNCQTFPLKYIHPPFHRIHPKSTYIFIPQLPPRLSRPVLLWMSIDFWLISL